MIKSQGFLFILLVAVAIFHIVFYNMGKKDYETYIINSGAIIGIIGIYIFCIAGMLFLK